MQYFRNLLSSETERLTGKCCTWENINDTTPGLTEDGKVVLTLVEIICTLPLVVQFFF